MNFPEGYTGDTDPDGVSIAYIESEGKRVTIWPALKQGGDGAAYNVHEVEERESNCYGVYYVQAIDTAYERWEEIVAFEDKKDAIRFFELFCMYASHCIDIQDAQMGFDGLDPYKGDPYFPEFIVSDTAPEVVAKNLLGYRWGAIADEIDE